MTDHIDTSTVQADFDRLATLLSQELWDHNHHYQGYLLKYFPRHCEHALEIGCGTGGFARLLASCAQHVLALDLSPQMIRIARECSTDYTNIDFVCADVMSYELPATRFDYIVSIATLHHLPMEEILLKLKDALKVNGVLAILDLVQDEGPSDFLTSIAAVPVNVVLESIRNGRLRPSREEREAWAEHGKNDHYLTLSQVHRICADLLSGAKVKRHLLWRYSLVWRKETD